jgi:predicted tellurium resistance membrane protein TerC
VFTSNIFAVLGLRSLYFLLAAVVDRFYLLKYGIAIILTFVGVKMLGERYVQIDILWSLAVILGVLGATIAASLIWPRREEGPTFARPEGKTGSIFGTRASVRPGAGRGGSGSVKRG